MYVHPKQIGRPGYFRNSIEVRLICSTGDYKGGGERQELAELFFIGADLWFTFFPKELIKLMNLNMKIPERSHGKVSRDRLDPFSNAMDEEEKGLPNLFSKIRHIPQPFTISDPVGVRLLQNPRCHCASPAP